MILDGASIYNDGVEINQDCEEKIRQIVNTLKTFSRSPEVSIRLLKNGNVYEGLLWGNANSTPIGAYNRGPSMARVLDTLYKRVKRECTKVWKQKGVQSRAKAHSTSQFPLALAG